MKIPVFLTVLMVFGISSASAQRKTVVRSPWVKDTTYYFAKHGADMKELDTLVILPWNKAWRSCCFVMCGGVRHVSWKTPMLLDIGIYRTRSGETTLKGGLGAYWDRANMFTTLDYHYSPKQKSSQVGLNLLRQFLPMHWAGGTQKVYLIRAGVNIGYYMPNNIQAQPYWEPKMGVITPFGRGHLYAGYRMMNTDHEAFLAAQGWHFGMTAFLNYR